jgi:hypothetical protein
MQESSTDLTQKSTSFHHHNQLEEKLLLPQNNSQYEQVNMSKLQPPVSKMA